MLQTNTCDFCRFMHRDGESGERCGRYPPSVVYVPVPSGARIAGSAPAVNWLVNAVWPPVRLDNWCGEFEAQE